MCVHSGCYDKYRVLGLKQQTFITQSSWGWKAKMKASADLVSGEGPLPGLQTAAFWLCPHIGLGGGGWWWWWWNVVRRERDMLVSLLQIRTLIPSGDPILMTFFKPGGGGGLVTKSCPTLCNPMDYNSPVSSVRGIFQARMLERVAVSFSRGSSPPRDWTWVSCVASWFFTTWATRAGPLNLVTFQRLPPPNTIMSKEILDFKAWIDTNIQSVTPC